MKRIIALLLAACMMLPLIGCGPAQPGDTTPSTGPAPKPTKPAPTEPVYTDGRIVIQAENPVDSYVDLEYRIDDNGAPFDHSNRRVDPDHKVQFCVRSTTCIIFSAFDTYTYTFEVPEAGTYSFAVLGSCDRDTCLDFTIDEEYDDYGFFVRNDYMGYDEVVLSEMVELEAGTHTITLKIVENKNHNFWIDCYFFIPYVEE